MTYIRIIEGRRCRRCDTRDRDAHTRRCLLCQRDRAEYILERRRSRWSSSRWPSEQEFNEAFSFLIALEQAYNQRASARKGRILRRGRERGAQGHFTAADLVHILEAQGGRCAYCPETRGLHVDHKTPLARGGSNWPSNLQYLCAFHNLSKNNKTDAEYRRLIGRPDPLHLLILSVAA